MDRRMHKSARNSRTPLGNVRAVLASDKFQQALQVALGIGISTLVTFVPSLRFSGSCLTTILFLISSVLYTTHPHVGAKLHAGTLMVSSSALAALTAGATVAAARAVSHNGVVPYIPTLCAFSALGLIPFSVLRTHLPLAAPAVIATFLYGMTVTRARFIEPPSAIWPEVVLPIFMAGALAGALVLLAGLLFLPSLAYTAALGEVSVAARSLGQSISWFTTTLWDASREREPALTLRSLVPTREGAHAAGAGQQGSNVAGDGGQDGLSRGGRGGPAGAVDSRKSRLARAPSGVQHPPSFLSQVDRETGSPQGDVGHEWQHGEEEEGEDDRDGLGPEKEEGEDDEEEDDEGDVVVRVVDAVPSRLLKPPMKPHARVGLFAAVKARAFRKAGGKGQGGGKPGAHPDRGHKLPQADACRLWPVLDRMRELLGIARREPPWLFPWTRGAGPVGGSQRGPACQGPCGGDVWAHPASELDAWQGVVAHLEALQSAVVSLAVVFEGGQRRFSSRTLWRWLGVEAQEDLRLVFATVVACCVNVARDVGDVLGGVRRHGGDEQNSAHAVHTRRQTFTEDREQAYVEGSARLVREADVLATLGPSGSLAPALRALQSRLSGDMVAAYKGYWASLQGSGSKCPINEVHALLYAMTISHSVIEAAIALEDSVAVAVSYRGPKAPPLGWLHRGHTRMPQRVRTSIAEEVLRTSMSAATRLDHGVQMSKLPAPAAATMTGGSFNATWPPRSPRHVAGKEGGPTGAREGHDDAPAPQQEGPSPADGTHPVQGGGGAGGGVVPPTPDLSSQGMHLRLCRPRCSKGGQTSLCGDSAAFLGPLLEALLLVPFLRHLANSARMLAHVGRAPGKGGGLGGLASGRLFQFGVKYWLACVMFLLAVLAVGPDHADQVDEWNAIWVFVTVTIVMMPKVEATVFKAVLRIIATVSGALLGFLFMMDEALAGRPVALAALLFLVALVSCYHIDCPYRYAVYLFVETVNLVVLCQYKPPLHSLASPCIVASPGSAPAEDDDSDDGCLRTGSFSYAASRAVTIVVGSLFSVVWGNTVLPWYASSQARVCLSRALVESARLYSCLWEDFLTTAARYEAAIPRSPPVLDSGSAPSSPHHPSTRPHLDVTKGGGSLPFSPRSGTRSSALPSPTSPRDGKPGTGPTGATALTSPWADAIPVSPRVAGAAAVGSPPNPIAGSPDVTPRQVSFTGSPRQGSFTGSPLQGSFTRPRQGSFTGSPWQVSLTGPSSAGIVSFPVAATTSGPPASANAGPSTSPLAPPPAGGVVSAHALGDLPKRASVTSTEATDQGEGGGGSPTMRRSALSPAALALGTGAVRQHLVSVQSILRAESVYWRRGVLIMPPLMSEAAAALTKLANRLASLRLIGGAPPRLTGVYTGHGVHLFAQLLRAEIREVLIATHELVQITARRLRDPEDRFDRLGATLAAGGGGGGGDGELGRLRAWWRRRKARHGLPSGSYYVVEDAAADNKLCLRGLLGAIQRLEDAREVFWKRYRSLRMGLHMDMKTDRAPEVLNVDDIFLLKSWQFAHMAFLDKVTLVAREVAAADGEVEPSWLIM